MNHRHIIVSLLLILFMGTGFAVTQAKPIVCKQDYALCTSAPCIPDPQHPDYAICSCVVEKGLSIGYKTCEQRRAKESKFKTKQIVSTFSFAEFNSKQNMSCAKGIPWTNCVDEPCTVNPMDSTKAICSCKIIQDQAFFTLGGDCDVKTCATGFWSGATIAASDLLRAPLLEALKLSKNPGPNNACSLKKEGE